MARQSSGVSKPSSQDSALDIVLDGRLSDLPPLPTHTVKIYISCSHTGMVF